MNPLKQATFKFGASPTLGASQVECDAEPGDCSDARRCDIIDSARPRGNVAMTTTPISTMESDAVRVKPDGCECDVTRYRGLLGISPYLHRAEVRRVEYSFPTSSPEYCHFKSRFQTFKDKWPKYLPGPTPEDLARAGFFYLGEGDKVKCFCCGVSIYEWEQKDSAYLEHARWSPTCPFLPLVGIRD